MSDDTPSPLGDVTIDSDGIKDHLGRSAGQRGGRLLDAEADRLCNAQHYERRESRRDARAGHFEREPLTKAREVRLKIPKSCRQQQG